MIVRASSVFLKERLSPVIVTCRRKSSKKYSETLNLPKTAFPLSMKGGAVLKREATIRKV